MEHVFDLTDGTIIDPPRIYGTGNFIDYYEATVENIASTVLVHEWYSHGIKHNGDEMKLHRLAYKNVINWKALWNKTTDNYKGAILRNLMKYIETETRRKIMDNLYINLYEKYKNFKM